MYPTLPGGPLPIHQLAHTGVQILPLMVVAVFLVVAGTVMARALRPRSDRSTSKRRN
ncbi:hypothetical protein [Kitasatospora kifunensis]|uniref:Uncharacterized protein n=1 Tax=Kitasatospora kifunensis TaxID=58351 RepID=A0A7W7RA46_KITKI|nr:hypothetical protein [Kitasatospora kifunensis]MBB4928240.1 hypothetical protein [Kitasatospora kifunensis]